MEVVVERGQREGREKGHLRDEEGQEPQKDEKGQGHMEEGQGHMKEEDHAHVIAMVRTDAPDDRQRGGVIAETGAPVIHLSVVVLCEIDQTLKNAVRMAESALDHDQRTKIPAQRSIPVTIGILLIALVVPNSNQRKIATCLWTFWTYRCLLFQV